MNAGRPWNPSRRAHSQNLSVIGNARAIAGAAGVDVGPFKMYDLCKAEYAAQILRHEHLRFVSTLMPCATALYTKADGKTYVAYMNVSLLAQMFGPELGDVARQAGEARDRALSFLNQ